MASGFPGSIDNFTDPLTTSALNSPSHAGQHQDLNDAVEKIETYMGLVKVIPTSPTGCAVSATGTVTIGNAVTTVAFTCFSALYDHYKLILSGYTASAAGNIFLQLTGITTSVYDQVGYYQNIGTATLLPYAANATSIICGYGASTSGASDIELRNPFLSTRKFGNVTAQSVGNQYSFPFAIGSTASATGVTITFAAGTLTGGTIRVYGYRN